MRFTFWAVFGCIALSAGPFDKLGPNDLARGKRLFEAQCSVCHGMNGAGGKGANLAVVKFRNAANDDALVEVVKNGVPDSEMPAAWWMNEQEAVQVAYFVRSLGRIASTIKIAGSIPAGKEVFLGKGGCAGCHIAEGAGGSMGPDLSLIGARRSPAHLRESILEPGKAVPEGFLALTVVDAAGNKIRCIRVNEDTFTIQVRNMAGKILSFRKSELREIHKDFGASPMPSYAGRLAEPDVDNLVAYLASLRGEK